MSSQQLFQKTFYASRQNKVDRGQQFLQEVIKQAEIDNDHITLVQSLVC